MEGPFRQTDLTDPTLRVIETLGWDGSAFARVERHFARAQASCAVLGFQFDPGALRRAIAAVNDKMPLRVRVTISRDGRVEVTTAPLPTSPKEWRVAVSPERLAPGNQWLRHKTTNRKLYDETRANLSAGVDEVIFCNDRGEVCEGTITNLFFDTGEGLSTPPLICGLLPGILREELLDRGTCREAILPETELTRTKLWVGNSLRGLIPARLVLETQQTLPHKQG